MADPYDSVGFLKGLVDRKGILHFGLTRQEWENIRVGSNYNSCFTRVFNRDDLTRISEPMLCLIQVCEPGFANEDNEFLLAWVGGKTGVATGQSRIKFSTIRQIGTLNTLETGMCFSDGIIDIISGRRAILFFEHLLETSLGDLELIAGQLNRPERYEGNESMQFDAVNLAIKAFSTSANLPIKYLNLFGGKTTLNSIPIREDTVIIRDAQVIPGLELVQADITGRAVFKSRRETLEVITANRQPLESLFGVDLIYLNLVQRSMVMVQYKMLDKHTLGEKDEWIYRPDRQLQDELARMELFDRPGPCPDTEYRLNSGIFFLKFVKRDGALKNASMILSLPHFRLLAGSERLQGPRGGTRVNWDELSGHYLRQGTFLGLIRSGYIGSFADTTNHLRVLVNEVLASGQAAVIAIQEAFDD